VSAWDTAKPLLNEAIDQDPHLLPRGFHAFYPAALPLSSQMLSYVAGVIRRHRRQIGSAWRKLNPGRQALLVLAYLRKGETFAELAAGFGIGTATAWRYVREAVALLARPLTQAAPRAGGG
jgi:Helix-turn-helix of DDE superfamily endonuclease